LHHFSMMFRQRGERFAPLAVSECENA
jgi:hypothetical protein